MPVGVGTTTSHQPPPATTSSHSNVGYGLRLLYQKHLLDYESHVTGIKATAEEGAADEEEAEAADRAEEEDESVQAAVELLLGLGAGPSVGAPPPSKRSRRVRRSLCPARLSLPCSGA